MSDIPFCFSGRNVFVAGGSSGINLGIAKRFAEAGANVSIVSRKQEKVDAAVAMLREYSDKSMGFAVDVRDYEALCSALQKTHEVLGSIDIVVSGAAGNFPAAAETLSANAFKTVLDIDTLGMFHVMRAAFPLLTKPGGVIINISAPQASQPMPLQVHACAAKAGVDMITRCLALEWGPKGVRVNAISPGPIEDTEGMARIAPTPELSEIVRKSVPLQRMGQAAEVADAALFLCSPVGSYINGAVLPVDGGWGLAGSSFSVEQMMDALAS